MIDFQKLIPQIVDLARESLPQGDHEKKRLEIAQSSFEQASCQPEKFENLMRENNSHTFWPLALPLEPFGRSFPVEECSAEHTIVACDGSHILPSQHEIAGCYLVNIGSAVFQYNLHEPSRSQLLSFPELFHRQEDIFPLLNQRRLHVDESFVSFQRTLTEFKKARELAENSAKEGRPVLTLIDGSLIPFNLERSPEVFQSELALRFHMEIDSYNAQEIPLLGYISHSRSSDLVNLLRVWNCPFPQSRCQSNCSLLKEEEFPCSSIWPLSDRLLLSTKLEVSSRSAFFMSQSRWAQELELRNRVCFAYLASEFETARIEIPYWLFQNKNLLSFALAALMSQVRKGQGYPIALAEAHNMAVIKQADRVQFYEILKQELLKQKQQLNISPKEGKKRRSFI